VPREEGLEVYKSEGVGGFVEDLLILLADQSALEVRNVAMIWTRDLSQVVRCPEEELGREIGGNDEM
jgi:hypothetical protein